MNIFWQPTPEEIKEVLASRACAESFAQHKPLVALKRLKGQTFRIAYFFEGEATIETVQCVLKAQAPNVHSTHYQT